MLFYILSIYLLLQKETPLKPASQFEIITNYQLKKKPASDNAIYVSDPKEKKDTGSDLLPYLTLQLKVKYWNPDVDIVKVVDWENKMVLRRKVNEAGTYNLDLGYVDDIKDGVTSGKYIIQFMEGKKIIEMIIVTIEKDGIFLVNNEKRGKF